MTTLFHAPVSLVRVTMHIVWLGCCLLGLLGLSVNSLSFGESTRPSLEVLKAGEIIVTDNTQPGGKTWVKAVFWMKANPDAVYQILRDAARFPEFMPDNKEVRILESGPGYQVVYFRAGEGLFESKHVLKRTYDDANRRVSWSLVKGRPRDLAGYWQVQPEPDGVGSLVTYSAYIDAGAWVPGAVARYFIRKTIPSMAANLKERVDSNGTWQSEEYRTRKP